LLSSNSLEYVLLYYAASRAGIVLTPLNYRLAPSEWRYILNDARPRLLLVAEPYLAAIDELRRELDSVKWFLSLSAARRSGWDNYHAWLKEAPATAAPDRSDWYGSEADALQLYTSATTGHPKGAILTHAGLAANLAQVGQAVQVSPGERSLVVAPLFHAAAVPSTFTPVAQGGTLIVHEAFKPADVLRALSEERVGYAVLVPAMIQACLNAASDGQERRFESLRLIYYGASPIAEHTLREAIRMFGCGFVQSYGMTEATQALTFLLPSDHTRALTDRPELLLSAGRAASDTQMRIVDPADQPLPNGQPGEIIARGPQLMRGYWNQPGETRQTLRGGWLHTGDVGSLDDEGYLYVRDRLKDMIVSGGENIYPRAVEEVLLQHPAVADAAVIGVPDERWGETVMAIVVLKPGSAATHDEQQEEIIGFSRRYLAGFEAPRSVEFVETLPRNPSGKVLKRILREPYWAGRPSRV